MADTHIHHPPMAANDAAPADALPVTEIGIADIKDALRQGYSDFMAQPSHLLFIALIYPIAGILLARLTVSYNIFPLLFPLASGFALLGPFAAIGLYEISRRRELGMDTSWKHALDVLHSPGIGQIALLGAVLTGVLILQGFNPWLCVLFSFVVGALAGCVTGLLNVKLKIRPLLCGILASAFAWAAPYLLNDLTPDSGCGLKMFDRESFLELPYFDHMHRFLPALFRRAGGEVMHVPVGHRPRRAGFSKYGTLDRLFVGIADLAGVMWLARRYRFTSVAEVGVTTKAGERNLPKDVRARGLMPGSF